jgi:hypothetical protein
MDTKIQKGSGANIIGILHEIANTLKTIHYGSMEIIVQDGRITQISTRHISKTNFTINAKEEKPAEENSDQEENMEENSDRIKIRIGY